MAKHLSPQRTLQRTTGQIYTEFVEILAEQPTQANLGTGASTFFAAFS